VALQLPEDHAVWLACSHSERKLANATLQEKGSRRTGRSHLLIVAVVASLALNVVALGWLAWIVADPSYWFPGAYAERGDRGPAGPLGPRGPVGPPGPVGPDAEDAVSSLSTDLEDLSARVDDLESGGGTSDLQSEIDDLSTTVESICSEFSFSDLEPLNDIYFAAC
jgi:hypothetical protein